MHKINNNMNSIISEILRATTLDEQIKNPLYMCETVKYQFKPTPAADDMEDEFSKRYRVKHLTEIKEFVDILKYVRRKENGKATIIPIATTGSLLCKICGNPRNAALFIKRCIRLGLLEMYNPKYQFGSYQKHLNKCRTYAYNWHAEKNLKILFEKYNIQTRPKEERAEKRIDLSEYDVRFDSNIRIPVIGNRTDFESTIRYELYLKYPYLRHYQEIAKQINETYYKDYPELWIKLEPTFHYSDSEKLLTKIGIRATSIACGSKKGKRGKFYGIMRSKIRKKFKIREYKNSDVKSSVPRITKSLNEGKWINEEIDIYEMIKGECSRIIDEKIKNKKTEMLEDLKAYSKVDTREDVKKTHMRSYFGKSDKDMSAKILWGAKNQNLQNTDYIKEICSINYEATRNIEGESFGSEVFLYESCIYLNALKKVLDTGNFCVLFYDSFESSNEFNREKIVEESFYEFLKIKENLKNKKLAYRKESEISLNNNYIKTNQTQTNTSIPISMDKSVIKTKNINKVDEIEKVLYENRRD